MGSLFPSFQAGHPGVGHGSERDLEGVMGNKNALAEPFGFVERTVGRPQQFIGGFAIPRRASASDAYPDTYRRRKTNVKG